MINLNTCVEGQKLRLRDEKLARYEGRRYCAVGKFNHAAIAQDGEKLTYTDCGNYYASGHDMRDVVGILPLETTDSSKHDKHPSVTWWESCPWITDRKPTKEDGDASGWVIIKATDNFNVLTACWENIEAGQHWVHRLHWKPPTLTDREQALQLLDDHRDGWRPTPEQWHVIRAGLKAS